MSTYVRETGASAGTWPFALGAMVRTIGGAATADGEASATADGLGLLAATPGEGAGSGRRRNATLAVSVGGIPGGGGGTSLPGRAPCVGRSFAGAQLTSTSPARGSTVRRPAPDSNRP